MYGKLRYRYLELDRNKGLALFRGNFDASIKLSKNSISEVQWWLKNINNAFGNVVVREPEVTFDSDASLEGWGSVFNGESWGGHWNNNESFLHINVLELKAIEFGLKSFVSKIQGKHVRVRSDSSTAVTYINNFGWVRSPLCHETTVRIWEFAIKNDIWLSAEFIPGSDNFLADKASRIFRENTEWSLKNSIFLSIQKMFGPFNIDLFASRLI